MRAGRTGAGPVRPVARAPAARTRRDARRDGRAADPARAADATRLLAHWREAVPDDRMAHLVKDATRALVRALQARLAPYDIPFGHWAFLRILWEADGITQRELSLRAGVMEPTTSAALNAMERRGVIERRRLPDSRRNVYVFLTREGRALKRRLVPLAIEVNEVALTGIAAGDVAATRRALLRMIENLAVDALRSGG